MHCVLRNRDGVQSAACKPGSVENGHLSKRKVANALERYCGNRTGRPMRSLHLAPNGVYMTVQSPDRRCALTAPFHPYRAKRGGISLLHLPWSRLHQPLAGILPYGARTFLMPCGTRPFSCLSHSFIIARFRRFVNHERVFSPFAPPGNPLL